MLQASLRYGIQQAAQAPLTEKEAMRTTVARQIEKLLADEPNGPLADQVRAALQDPQAIIEIRCGKQVQTVTPDMPLRELIAPASSELEIVVSKPHVGG